MPVPSTIADLSTVAADNYPQGSESIGTNLDDYIRSGFAITKQVYALMGQLAGTNTWTGPQTYSSAVTFSSSGTHNGTETFNQPAIFANGIGLGGAIYGSVGQVPVSSGAGVAASWKYPFVVPCLLAYTTSATLVSSQVGTFIYFAGSTNGQTITLPLGSAIQTGNTISIQNVATVPVTIVNQGLDLTYTARGGSTPVSSLSVEPGESITFVFVSGTTWLTLSNSPSRIVHSVRLNTALTTASGYGTTNAKYRRFTTTVLNTGSAITYADSATLGATFTVNVSGIYAVHYSDCFQSSASMGISVNSSQPTTSISGITVGNIIAETATTGANWPGSVSSVLYLSAGDVIRAHTDGALGSASHPALFTITRVS